MGIINDKLTIGLIKTDIKFKKIQGVIIRERNKVSSGKLNIC